MEAVCEGIADSGITAVQIGLGPTPMLYFAVQHFGVDGGIQITGSHNPAGYNGFKMLIGPHTMHGEALLELVRVAESGDFAGGNAPQEYRSISDDYVEALLTRVGDCGALRCAWDPGNGAVGAVLSRVVERLDGQHVVINEVVDGAFPAHHPDPTEEKNLADLRALVKTDRCDIGFAFDGDGDRLGIVDRFGRIVWPDQYLALLARSVLKKRPGAKIIADVKASDALFESIAKAGGQPVMWKTGHSLIKRKMQEIDAPLAGEMSGHVFFADRWFGFDDALYAALRVLEVLEEEGITMDAFFDRLPKKVNTPEIRLLCDDDIKFSIISAIHSEINGAGAKMIDIDGMRVKSGNGWWLLRASNTQPALIVRCEADDAESLFRIKSELANVLKRIGVDHAPLLS
jgi:phosphomannomutase